MIMHHGDDDGDDDGDNDDDGDGDVGDDDYGGETMEVKTMTIICLNIMLMTGGKSDCGNADDANRTMTMTVALSSLSSLPLSLSSSYIIHHPSITIYHPSDIHPPSAIIYAL